MKAIAIIAFAAQGLPAVLALCCASLVCWDLKPHRCCATVSCNIFCCICDDRCLNPYGLLIQSDPGDEAFALADSTGNGNLTLDQYLEYMGIKGQPEIWIEWFEKHDKNGDGVITENEIEAL